MTQQHAINWFEIPTANFERAVTFYETLLATTLRREDCSGMTLAVFPYQPEQGIGGALIAMPEYTPSNQGSILYLNAGDSLSATLARIEGTEGNVTLAPVALPEGMGFFAHILDSEGNKIGLHALQA